MASGITVARKLMSLVEDATQIAELQAMQNGGLDSVPLQMMLRSTPSLPRKKATAVAAKKKERSELRGKFKERQFKYEKEHAENSQKLIDPMQSRVQMGAAQCYKSQG